MKKRSKVLEWALLLESTTSAFLAFLLDIDPNSSRTMGNKNTALSFNAKIDLLTDINSMKREDAKKFLDFMQIRNQFMHNARADSFTTCFGLIDGLDKRLLKLYPQNDIDELEDAYEKCFDTLVTDLFKCILDLMDKVKEKINDKVNADMNEKLVHLFKESIEKITSDTDNFLSAKGIHPKNLGEQIKKGIYTHVIASLDNNDTGSPDEDYPRILGQHVGGSNIILGKNDNGFYLKCEDGVKDRSVMVPTSVDPGTITLEQGLKILKLQ